MKPVEPRYIEYPVGVFECVELQDTWRSVSEITNDLCLRELNTEDTMYRIYQRQFPIKLFTRVMRNRPYSYPDWHTKTIERLNKEKKRIDAFETFNT